MNDTKRKIIEYLAERDIWIRGKTPFEKEPCYLCQEFDPWWNVDSDGHYGYKSELRPCMERRNYCHSFDKLCAKYKEAGKTYWSAERWRINNKPEYHFMNANIYRKYDSSISTKNTKVNKSVNDGVIVQEKQS